MYYIDIRPIKKKKICFPNLIELTVKTNLSRNKRILRLVTANISFFISFICRCAL